MTSVFITYLEVTGQKPDRNEVSLLIASLNKRDTFFFLSMLNNFLALFPPIDNEQTFADIQRFMARNLFSPELYNKVRQFVENVSLVSRPIFHRPSILFLMKRVLLEAKDEGGLTPGENHADRPSLGELCLKISDLLVTDEQQALTESENPLEENESERVLNELLTQMLPVSELMNPPNFFDALSRTNQYLNVSEARSKTVLDGKTISSYFEASRGLSLKTFLQMMSGVYGVLMVHELKDFIDRPQEFNIRKSVHFSNLDYDENEVKSFFDLTARSYEGLVQETKDNPLREGLLEQYDFTTFRKYPLFHLSEDVITTTDASFLAEKASFGLYHTILNLVRENGLNPEPFLSEWGYVFEQHVNETLRVVYPEISGRFHTNSFFDTKEEQEGPDGVLEYATAIIPMEYKGGLLNVKAKYGGDAETLLREMDSKFGRASNRSGIKQIARKIELLFHRELTERKRLKGLDFSTVVNIYPTLVVNELSLQFGLTHWRLRQWFEKEISERQIVESVKVHPLMIMTIEDLEGLIPYLEADDFTFLEFAEFYSRLEYVRFSWWLIREHWYEPMTTLNQVLSKFRKERNIEYRQNKHVDKGWDDFLAELFARFKPGFEEEIAGLRAAKT